jgi:hypothetical protein
VTPYRGGVIAFGIAFIVLGVAMTVRTALDGVSFGIGYVLGPLFVALGAARIYLALRKR